METNEDSLKDDAQSLTDRLTQALQESADFARALHRAFGQPLVIWRDGRVQHVDPETLDPVDVDDLAD